MLEVKRIYNCLLDFVPSVSCKNTASNKFLLLAAKKRKEILNHLLYDPNKEILGQKQGINLFLDAGSNLKHIQNCTAGCSPLNVVSSFLLPCPATVLVATLMSLSRSTACGLPLWMPSPASSFK